MRVRSAGRPGQRFVPVRSIDNQVELMRHRARELLAGQRTAMDRRAVVLSGARETMNEGEVRRWLTV